MTTFLWHTKNYTYFIEIQSLISNSILFEHAQLRELDALSVGSHESVVTGYMLSRKILRKYAIWCI